MSLICNNKEEHCHVGFEHFNQERAVQNSRARLIRTANAWKNHANYPSMRIILAHFMLRSYEWQRVVSRASMRIKQGVRISEGQIIQAILYYVE